MSWTEEKVNKLKELWGKGQTASQIAEILGGVSRNAVIGKAHRLNLSLKIKTKSLNTKRQRKNRDEFGSWLQLEWLNLQPTDLNAPSVGPIKLAETQPMPNKIPPRINQVTVMTTETMRGNAMKKTSFRIRRNSCCISRF